MISGVLDSIFAESDDVPMRSNRQLSGGDEGHLETLVVETDKSSRAEKFESPKIESLADIESITDGRVILKGSKNENGRSDNITGDFSENAEQINEQGEEAESQKEEDPIEKKILQESATHEKEEETGCN